MIVFGKERDYIEHSEHCVKGFFGEEFRYLSNFHICPVYFEGKLYQSSENAYMAAKTEDLAIREQVAMLPPNKAKRFGTTIILRPGWVEMKYDVMSACVFDKFYRNHDIRKLLLDTGDKYLEETNHWGDVWYGVCDGVGQNNLGKILMATREFWKMKEKDTNILSLK